MHTEDLTKLKIDVLIPTHQPGRIFSELLKRLDAQSLRPAHVRVINTEEAYWDPQFEADYPGLLVEHITKEEFDHGWTRHKMALASDADLLLYMTQDALPADRRLLEHLAEQFLDGNTAARGSAEDTAGDEPLRIAAAYARQLPRLDCSTLEKYTRAFNYSRESRIKTKNDLTTLGIKTFFCSNVCAMYDREIYLELGGFPYHTIFNEDMIFARGLIDAGYGIAYAADARVVHSHNYTGKQQFHRNFDLAVSQAQYPEVFADVPAEGEGIRMIRRVAGQVCRAGRPWLVFPLIWQSGCKYMGYLLGKRYRRLPEKLVKRCSQNKSFWEGELK
ncbi:MAG: glycosyltransferase family 2 protein [Eubacterium sp.]|nr:glycosyltransferase family 2 protein [Eubacterium sp.]